MGDPGTKSYRIGAGHEKVWESPSKIKPAAFFAASGQHKQDVIVNIDVPSVNSCIFQHVSTFNTSFFCFFVHPVGECKYIHSPFTSIFGLCRLTGEISGTLAAKFSTMLTS